MIFVKTYLNPDRLEPHEFAILFLSGLKVFPISIEDLKEKFYKFVLDLKKLMGTKVYKKKYVLALQSQGCAGKVARQLIRTYCDCAKKNITYRKYKIFDKEGLLIPQLKFDYVLHENMIYAVPKLQEREDIAYEY